MTRAQWTYLGYAAVFVASLVLFYMLSGKGELVELLAAIPSVGALVGVLVQILRDQAAHDRALLILDSQNRFVLGASSHMASVAFDKHVQFSEEYAQEAYKALWTLLREGPTQRVLDHAGILYGLQQKYSVWLTARLENDLEIFESALRRIGAAAGYVYGSPGPDNRQKVLDEMYKTFADVLGAERMGADKWQGDKLTDEVAMSMMVRRLRAISGH